MIRSHISSWNNCTTFDDFFDRPACKIFLDNFLPICKTVCRECCGFYAVLDFVDSPLVRAWIDDALLNLLALIVSLVLDSLHELIALHTILGLVTLEVDPRVVSLSHLTVDDMLLNFLSIVVQLLCDCPLGFPAIHDVLRDLETIVVIPHMLLHDMLAIYLVLFDLVAIEILPDIDRVLSVMMMVTILKASLNAL